MPTVTSRRAKPSATVLKQRAALCRELLEIESKHARIFARIKAIEKELKKIATDGGDSFREEIADLGTVDVSPAKDAEFKGNVPQIQSEAWLALPPAERKRLEKSGVVKMIAEWGSKSYGRVSVRLV